MCGGKKNGDPFDPCAASSSSWVQCSALSLQVEVLGVLDALDEVRLLKAVVALDATLHEDLRRGAGTGNESLRMEWGKVGCRGQESVRGVVRV
jgi:hypothetical protein